MAKKLPADEVYKQLETLFHPDDCWDIFEKKGIQQHNTDWIENVFTATFASEAVLQKVIDIGVSNAMIFTHHPIPPRPEEDQPYPQIPARLIEELEKSGISLYSLHIPMDRHGAYSPGYTLARALGMEPKDTFYTVNGVTMGEICDSRYKTTEQLRAAAEAILGNSCSLCQYGDSELMDGRVAIMAGCASRPEAYEQLRKRGVNVMLTGVTSLAPPWAKDVHQQARENRISLVGGTHYSTEKFAPAAMTRFFEDMGLSAMFIPEQPNLNDL